MNLAGGQHRGLETRTCHGGVCSEVWVGLKGLTLGGCSRSTSGGEGVDVQGGDCLEQILSNLGVPEPAEVS